MFNEFDQVLCPLMIEEISKKIYAHLNTAL